jgi:ribose transport system permease protein
MKRRGTLQRQRPILLAYLFVAVLAIIGEIVTRAFLETRSVDELIIEASIVAFVAIGQTFVILTGGIDLSIPWVLNGAATLLTLWTSGGNAKVYWVVPLVLVMGGVIGLANGIVIALVRIPPIIMTLAMSAMVEGGLLLYTNGESGPNAPSSIVFLAIHRWGPIPVVGVLWLAILAIVSALLAFTPFGRRLYATGLNRRAAEFSGVNVNFATIVVYAVSGVTAALAGVILAGYVNGAYLGMGTPYLFSSVAAVAIGGASILGGTGNYVGTTAGALAITILAALLPILGFSESVLEIIYGVVILGAVSIQSIRKSGPSFKGETIPQSEADSQSEQHPGTGTESQVGLNSEI